MTAENEFVSVKNHYSGVVPHGLSSESVRRQNNCSKSIIVGKGIGLNGVS